jgi:hypothetical protein
MEALLSLSANKRTVLKIALAGGQGKALKVEEFMS